VKPSDRDKLIAKLRAGKSLSKAERLCLADLGEKIELDPRKASGARNRALAERWDTSLRSMHMMLAEGIAMEDDAAVAEWYKGLSTHGQANLRPGFRRKILEAIARLQGVDPANVPTAEDDLAAFNREYKPTAGDKDNLAELKRERAYYLFRLQKARGRSDYAGEAEAAKHYRSFSDIINECELRALKLGRDLGDSFSAADVERLGRGAAYWLMNNAHNTIAGIAKGLVDAGVPLERDAVRKIVEPLILADRVLGPLTRATLVNVGVRLPPQFVNAIRDGLASCLEDGEKEFEKLYAMPVPLPVKVAEEALTA
jgi:hypothetical protein